MVRKALKSKKRFVVMSFVAGVLALSVGAAFDTSLGGADRAQAGIDTSPGMPGR